jgi:hypothetical protein
VKKLRELGDEGVEGDEGDLEDAKATETKTDETETETVSPGPGKLLDVLRTAAPKDKWYCVVGLAAAVVSGANQPTSLIIFGHVLDSFNQEDESAMQKAIELLACLYVVIAVQMFISQFLQTACMTAVAAKQTKRIREDYFSALVIQPISFFDSTGMHMCVAYPPPMVYVCTFVRLCVYLY